MGPQRSSQRKLSTTNQKEGDLKTKTSVLTTTTITDTNTDDTKHQCRQRVFPFTFPKYLERSSHDWFQWRYPETKDYIENRTLEEIDTEPTFSPLFLLDDFLNRTLFSNQRIVMEMGGECRVIALTGPRKEFEDYENKIDTEDEEKDDDKSELNDRRRRRRHHAHDHDHHRHPYTKKSTISLCSCIQTFLWFERFCIAAFRGFSGWTEWKMSEQDLESVVDFYYRKLLTSTADRNHLVEFLKMEDPKSAERIGL